MIEPKFPCARANSWRPVSVDESGRLFHGHVNVRGAEGGGSAAGRRSYSKVSRGSEEIVMRTRLCELLGIEYPIIQAGMGIVHPAHALVAAVSNAGALGSLGAALRSPSELREQIPLIPQVVDAVRPLPVVAAGGIGDGRGIAAALLLGAAGVNMGTRFLASVEAPIAEGWKKLIIAAQSEDAIKVELWNDISRSPMGRAGYGTVPRALRTPFHDQWAQRRAEAVQKVEELRGEIQAAVAEGRFHEYMPFAGQSAGLIHEVLPVREIIRP